MCSNTTHQHTKKSEEEQSPNHQKEHKTWSRRAFMHALGLTGAGSMVLSNTVLSASAASPLADAINNSETDRVLVVVRLKGGNDGLNTIIPVYDYDAYAGYRPSIKINQNNLLSLDPDFGVPNYMQGVKNLWDDGKMKVVHGVGYNDQNLSHFQGSDNWATTDVVNEDEDTGWLGRYFQEIYPDFLNNPPEKPAAIQIGNRGNLIFEGTETSYALTVANPQQLYQIASEGTLYSLDNLPNNLYGDQAEYLRGLANTTLSYAEVINTAYESSTDGTGYTNGDLSSQLNIVARLIKGNLGTKIYFVSLGGFDTHNSQPQRHQALMEELSGAMEAFYNDLSDQGLDNKVLAMTISEFGRRTAENGSNGTDHGAASQMMLFGTGLEGNGFISQHPDLNDLDNRGNLKYNLDFRQVYSSVLTDWLCVDPEIVNVALLGTEFDSLPMGYSCEGILGTEEIIPGRSFVHHAIYNNKQVSLRFVLTESMHVDIKIYAITGQQVTTLSNTFANAGEHLINISEKTSLLPGTYIYKIATRRGYYSKQFIVP